jgi:hypothetical protein
MSIDRMSMKNMLTNIEKTSEGYFFHTFSILNWFIGEFGSVKCFGGLPDGWADITTVN